MEGKGQSGQKIIALVLFGFALLYLLASLGLKVGSTREPGPGLIPLTIGVLLLICTAVYLLRVLKGEFPEDEPAVPVSGGGRDYRAIVGILACTATYPFVLEWLKFMTATFLVLFVMLVLLRPRSLLFAFLFSAVAAVGSFLTFARLLGVGLPFGPLETMLFRIGG